MGDLIPFVMTLIKGAPTEATLILSATALFLTMWLKSREVDITSATSISRLQQEQTKTMMEQNKMLAEELAKLRDKMADTFRIMEEMRAELSELEDLVRRYERKCDNCPGADNTIRIVPKKQPT